MASLRMNLILRKLYLFALHGVYAQLTAYRVRELNIISLGFLRTSNTRTIVLAILYRDPHKKLAVTSHELSGSPLELSPSSSAFLPEFSIADADSTLLIPVPPQTKGDWNTNGGVLVLGGSTIAFYPIERKQKKKKNGPATPKASGARVAEAEAKWSLCDITAYVLSGKFCVYIDP